MAFRDFRVREHWSLSSRQLSDEEPDRAVQSNAPRQLTAAERERAYRYAREHRVSMAEGIRQLFSDE